MAKQGDVGVGAQRRDLLDAPLLVEQISEVENVELDGETLPRNGETLPDRDVDLVHEGQAARVALEKLAALDPQQAKIVELRYFGGLTVEEVAEALEISPATVKRHWTVARAWLHKELSGA